jgi:hypothetical protein
MMKPTDSKALSHHKVKYACSFQQWCCLAFNAKKAFEVPFKRVRRLTLLACGADDKRERVQGFWTFKKKWIVYHLLFGFSHNVSGPRV